MPARPEYVDSGHRLGLTTVIFSHGFGVDKTSNGVFDDIAASLPAGYGSVLFDYYDETDKALSITTFDEQQRRLHNVMDWTITQPGVKEVVLVSHSMGCIVAALLASSLPSKVIMLAPPLSVGENIRQYFTSKEGAYKQAAEWVVPRSSGAVSRIPERLFDEFEKIDAQAALLQYGQQKPYDMIIAGHDEVLAGQDYKPLAKAPIKIHMIAEADHNFSGQSRQELTNLLSELLVG